MTASRQALGISLLAFVFSPRVPHAQLEVDQRALARQLVAVDRTERAKALDFAAEIEPEKTGQELRAALMAALEREGRLTAQRETTQRDAASGSRREKIVEELKDPEFIARAARVVAALHDPNAILALNSALGSGFPVIRALAEFGEQAAPAVLATVMSPESMHYAVDHGLITLRFMVEQANAHPLSPATRAQIRSAAEQHLKTGKGLAITTLRCAIDLAAVLKDPDLRRTVASLAVDANAIVARGVEDPEQIERTQLLANQRLAGIPPLPRP